MADFETSTEEWLKIDGKARVWASAICKIEEEPKEVKIFNNIDDFMAHLEELANAEVYFHNLRYDGYYIVNWLLNNHFRYDKNGNKPHTFSSLIDGVGQWYSITIIYETGYKKLKKISILDSLKKLPLSVSEIAKAFNLEEAKGEIDYDTYRKEGYVLTEEEKEYIKNDVVIVAKALYMQFETGLTKMTASSDALSSFKAGMLTKSSFRYYFPVLPIEVDNDIRRAYKGGFTMLNPKFKNKEVSGISFDVNSLYPAVMYGLMGDLPYGKPKVFDGEYQYDKLYPLYITHFVCEFKVKKGHIPTIQLKGNRMFVSTEYVRDSKGMVELFLTSPDFELFMQHYDVWNLQFINGYKFKGMRKCFREYIDYWMNIKKNSTGGKRQLAKLMLNSLYGKFATNPRRINREPFLEDEIVNLVIDEEVEYVDPIYTPLGAFITARARAWTISNSQKLYDHWVYSDTDSMYLADITEEEASKVIQIHPKDLGKWKLEHHFTRGKFLKPKTYIIKSIEDGITITCAGMPKAVKQEVLNMTEDEVFKKFTYLENFDGKLKTKVVKGGVVLCHDKFTIKR